ncbi:MAG: PAS domain-containing protein [Dehalococcoidales bacterium]|nr:PAS domain-containing protein [Dehalococcoidales bacterium]
MSENAEKIEQLPTRARENSPGPVELADGRASQTNTELEGVVENRTSQLMRAIQELRKEIRERKELERNAKVHNTILRLFLETTSLPEYLERVGKLLRQSVGCRCLGIRALDDNGNIPFAWYEGYGAEFLAAENNLSLKRDNCACIRIIAGRTEPHDALALTPAGSFCTNDIAGFMDGLSSGGESRYRGACLRQGFQTLAVIPIRYGGRAIGAVHIADERQGVLPPRKVKLAESIVPLIGEAVYRFRVEQELKESKTALEEAQRIAHVGNFSWNILTDEVHWSNETFRIFGHPPRFEPTYAKFLQCVHPDDREVFRKSVDEALYQNIPHDLGYRVCLPDGSVRTVHARGEVSIDENGKPVRMVGTVYDITDHIIAEEQMRSLSRRLVEIQEEERRVIARDLHDQVGQSLTMLNILVDRAIRSSPENVGDILSDAKTLARELMGLVREMSLNLRPSILDDLGLLAALTWLFERFTARTGIKVNFEHSRLEADFSWDVRTTAFRIVQEALNNVMRYANASEATVRAEVKENVLRLEIADHGIGFDPGKVATTSTGIRGMEERARLLGGSLVVNSAPGSGTSISVKLPLGAKVAKVE